jgi:Spy/CpxP family protein refolding chaperone
MGGFLGGMIADHLELSEAQREEIRGLLDAAHENSASLWSELQESRDALMDASAAEPFDEASVRAAAARLADAEAEVAIHRAGVIAQVRGVLTPEQQVQAEAFHERMRERREEFRGHHRGHGGGGWGDVD